MAVMLMFRPLLRYADFKGRASRSEYFLFLAFQFGALGLCVALAVNALSGLERDPAGALVGLLASIGLAGLLLLVCALPNYAVLSRRLHDSNKSARWMALLLPDILAQMIMILSAGQVVRMAMSGIDRPEMINDAMSALGGSLLINAVALLCRLALFVMTLLPGTRGPNRFGADPRDPEGVMALPAGQTTGPDRGGYSEERLDALIAEAKREQEKSALQPSPARTGYPSAAYGWPDTGFSAGAAPQRTFGRRGA